MHYFKNLGLLVDPSEIVKIHIGREADKTDVFGKSKHVGTVKIVITYQNKVMETISIGGLDYQGIVQTIEKIEKEISEYFCSKEPKEAKEDPTDNIFFQAEKELEEKGILTDTPA